MTAPTVNGVKYPQPVDELLPHARKLAAELDEIPSRNRLMREFRIGAPKADELRDRLAQDLAREPVQVLRELLDRAAQGSPGITGEEIAAEYRLDPTTARLVGSLAHVGVRRRAEGLPIDLDGDWATLRPADEGPAPDPWDHAEPIGPDPVGEQTERPTRRLPPLPDPVGSDRHGPGCACPICTRIAQTRATPDTDEPDAPPVDPAGPAPADPGTDPLDIPLDDTRAPAAEPDRVEALRSAMAVRGALLTPRTGPADTRVRIDDDERPEIPEAAPAVERSPEVTTVGHPGTKIATPAPAGPVEMRSLLRIRWAVRAVLVLGVAASIAGNVLHARDEIISQIISAWSPLALLLTIELISRVPVHRRHLAVARWAATALIAGIAAWVSYWHMAAVAARYGETNGAQYLLPLSVDGLVVVASICLVELGGRIAANRPVNR